MARYPLDAQQATFFELLRLGAKTDFGRRYEIELVESIEDFQTHIPLSEYDSMGDYLRQMLDGQADVTARGRIGMFARSSGTTSGRSKYIPVTRRVLWSNHLRGMRDVVTLYLEAYPSSRILDGKALTLGGSCNRMGQALVGDLSALLIDRTHLTGGWFRLPRTATALLPDFEQKVERICRECTGENITSFAGVPSWNLALMRRVLEYTGKSDLRQVWSGLELFVHGGVGFAPYRNAFAELFPGGNIRYMETYNASEGFFAIADDPSREDMLLMLDYAMALNGSSFGLNMQLFGILVREMCRDPKDYSRRFVDTDMKSMNNYQQVSIKMLPNYISPYVSITSENFDESLMAAVLLSDKKEEDIAYSPLEKVLMM